MIAATSLQALALLKKHPERIKAVHDNSQYFRRALTQLGFKLTPGEHPIVPVMLGEATLATQMATALLQENIYVIGFSYPVVPMGGARIRTQLSAAHEKSHLEQAVHAFEKVGKVLEII